MQIVSNKEGSSLVLTLSGRLDTMTSPELEEALKQGLPEIENVIIDLTDLQYISSMGLRVLVSGHKMMTAQNGQFVLRNPNEFVSDVLATTGLDKVLIIKS